jgi:hypothetical protein
MQDRGYRGTLGVLNSPARAPVHATIATEQLSPLGASRRGVTGAVLRSAADAAMKASPLDVLGDLA